jgi:hypothetical protein
MQEIEVFSYAQIANRFSSLEFPRWQEHEDFRGLLALLVPEGLVPRLISIAVSWDDSGQVQTCPQLRGRDRSWTTHSGRS